MSGSATASGDWTHPGAHPVAEGVHRVPLPLPSDGLRAVNVYVLTTGEGFVLVDGGWAIPGAMELLDTSLRSLGGSVADIRRVLVTHAHRDHYTQAIELRRKVGCSIALGTGERATLDILHDPRRTGMGMQLERLRRFGATGLADRMAVNAPEARERDPEVWEYPDVWLAAGTVALPDERCLDAVPTPGHTAGHVVFHDTENKLLFAGDHVLPTITPSIGFEAAVTSDPLADFLRSLAVVRARPDAMLLPAHGVVQDSVHARVDALLDHHAHRLDQAEAAVAAGGATPAEVAARLRWTRRERRLDELDDQNAMLAVVETGAHLEVLKTQGRVTRETVDGVLHYQTHH